jgi:hypothetical protein
MATGFAGPRAPWYRGSRVPEIPGSSGSRCHRTLALQDLGLAAPEGAGTTVPAPSGPSGWQYPGAEGLEDSGPEVRRFCGANGPGGYRPQGPEVVSSEGPKFSGLEAGTQYALPGRPTMSPTNLPDPFAEVRRRLERAGWAVGIAVHYDATAVKTWVVTGQNGENLIRAEGPTRAEAWIRAVEQARSLGMLGR